MAFIPVMTRVKKVCSYGEPDTDDRYIVSINPAAALALLSISADLAHI